MSANPQLHPRFDSDSYRDAGEVDQPPGAARGGRRKAIFPAGWFALLAVELFLFATLLGLYLVAARSWPDAFQKRVPAVDELLWAGLQMAVLALAAGSAVLGLVAMNRGWRRPAALFLVATLMYGLVFLGALGASRLAGTGADWEEAVAAAVEAHGVRGEPGPGEAAGQPLPEPALLGDAEQGTQPYLASCASCHGRGGEGQPGVTPSLLDSPFLGSASDQQLLAVILEGRAAGAPDNRTGRLMPARGGNPFLTDQQAGDIAAFLRQLADSEQTAVAAVDPQELVPRWVVPPAAEGPLGLDQRALDKITPLPPPAVAVELLADGLATAFATLWIFHVGLGLALTGWLWVQVWEGPRTWRLRLLARACCLGWVAGAMGWLFVIPLLFRLG